MTLPRDEILAAAQKYTKPDVRFTYGTAGFRTKWVAATLR